MSVRLIGPLILVSVMMVCLPMRTISEGDWYKKVVRWIYSIERRWWLKIMIFFVIKILICVLSNIFPYGVSLSIELTTCNKDCNLLAIFTFWCYMETIINLCFISKYVHHDERLKSCNSWQDNGLIQRLIKIAGCLQMTFVITVFNFKEVQVTKYKPKLILKLLITSRRWHVTMYFFFN